MLIKKKGGAVIIGYTHHWHRETELNKAKFSKASKDCKKICKSLSKNGLSLVFEDDSPKEPIFTDSLVRFNGVEDEGCETFYIQREFTSQNPQFDRKGRAYAYCKTSEKPYDIAVCACLIIFRHWFPDMKVSSEGNISDWEPAIKAVRSVFGKDYVQGYQLSKN